MIGRGLRHLARYHPVTIAGRGGGPTPPPTPGRDILVGTTAPDPSQGNPGDLYFQLAIREGGDVLVISAQYLKNAGGSWQLIGAYSIGAFADFSKTLPGGLGFTTNPHPQIELRGPTGTPAEIFTLNGRPLGTLTPPGVPTHPYGIVVYQVDNYADPPDDLHEDTTAVNIFTGDGSSQPVFLGGLQKLQVFAGSGEPSPNLGRRYDLFLRQQTATHIGIYRKHDSTTWARVIDLEIPAPTPAGDTRFVEVDYSTTQTVITATAQGTEQPIHTFPSPPSGKEYRNIELEFTALVKTSDTAGSIDGGILEAKYFIPTPNTGEQYVASAYLLGGPNQQEDGRFSTTSFTGIQLIGVPLTHQNVDSYIPVVTGTSGNVMKFSLRFLKLPNGQPQLAWRNDSSINVSHTVRNRWWSFKADLVDAVDQAA